jgi:hypothetical protein
MSYDSAVISFTTKTDKVDLVQAAHMNAVQAELVTIETILGTNVKGDRADLKTRLNNALDADGSLLSGTSFPSPALASQMFYRTDLNTNYIRNAANDTWLAQGGNLSNVLFSFVGQDNAGGAGGGAKQGFIPDTTSLVATLAADTYAYWAVYVANASTYSQIIPTFKWVKLSGVSTVTIYARFWQNLSSGASNVGTLKVDIGGQSGTASCSDDQQTPQVISFTIDVSSLTNGTAYDVTATVAHTQAAAYCYLSALVGISS